MLFSLPYILTSLRGYTRLTAAHSTKDTNALTCQSRWATPNICCILLRLIEVSLTESL
jgi:hypothetical protein